MRLHDLRHWYASTQLDAGVDRIIFVPYKYEMEQIEALATDVIPRLKAG